MIPGSWFTPWEVLEPIGGSVVGVCVNPDVILKSFFYQLYKNIELDKKINLLWCLRATLHHDKILEPVVVIAVGVGVHQAASNLFN